MAVAAYALGLTWSLPAAATLTVAEYTWSSVAIGGGGFVSAVITTAAESGLFFVRTDVGGAYRWIEETQVWKPLTDWVSEDETGYLGVESIAIDPASPNRVFMLVGIDYFNNGRTAILRSSDYGDTFEVTEVTNQFKAHGNGMGRQTGEKLAVDPNQGSVLLCGTRRNGLFKSTDSGASWEHVTGLDVTTTPNDNGIAFVLFDGAAGSPGAVTPGIYIGVSRSGSSNLFVSTDAGASFSPVLGAPITFMPGRAALSSSGALYITYGNGAGPHPIDDPPEPMDAGAIWRYQPADVGNEWKNITPAGLNRAYSGISIDASNPNHVVATTVNTYMQQPWGWGDRILRSTDGGDSWTDLFGLGRIDMSANDMPWIVNHAVHWAGTIQIDPFNPDRAFISSGNGVFLTENLTETRPLLKFAARGLEETVPLDLVSIPGGPMLSAIGDYDGFVHTSATTSPTDGSYAPSMGTTTGLAVAAAMPNQWVRVGSNLYLSENAGVTWRKLAKPAQGGREGKVALSADGSVLLWAPDRSSTTFRTANQGQMWTAVAGIDFRATPVSDMVNANKFYAYRPSSGQFYLSTDQGVSFAAAGNAGTGGSRLIRIVPGVEGEIWIALGDAGLTRSTDSGASFNALPSVTSADAVGFGKAPPGATFPVVFIWGSIQGEKVGVYRSDDAGSSWCRVNDDAHEYGGPGNGQFILGDMNVFGRVYMSTAGRGIAYGQPVGTIEPIIDAGIAVPDAGPDAAPNLGTDSQDPIDDKFTGTGCLCRSQPGQSRLGGSWLLAACLWLARRRKSRA